MSEQLEANRPVELSALDRADIRRELEARIDSLELDAKLFRAQHRERFALELDARVARVRQLIALLAMLLLCACAGDFPLEEVDHALQVEAVPQQTLPLDVYLEDVPEADRRVWRAAIDAWNRETWVEAFVLHEEPGAGCGVYVGPGVPGWSFDGCMARLSYDPCDLWCTAGHQLGHVLGLPDEDGEPRSVMHPSCSFVLPNRFNGAAVRQRWGIP